MHLRGLEIKDAPLMLEWMHDPGVTRYMRTDFSAKTLDDAEAFIRSSRENSHDVHLAIASDSDVYMGTVSLKYVEDGSAEFAITVRSEAMSRGYSWYAMEEILRRAFSEMGLNSVYWCVSRQNIRAMRFYDKHHFNEVLDIPQSILARYEGIGDLKWYAVLSGDDFNVPDCVAGCKVIRVKTISTVNAGELSFFEGTHDIDFEIKRIYYISKVPEGVRRGFHAHRKLKQLLFCPYGRIQLILENRNGREEIELSDPGIGVVIDQPTWREMLWLQKDSVLCVAASDYYDEKDYIRDYVGFKRAFELEE